MEIFSSSKTSPAWTSRSILWRTHSARVGTGLDIPAADISTPRRSATALMGGPSLEAGSSVDGGGDADGDDDGADDGTGSDAWVMPLWAVLVLLCAAALAWGLLWKPKEKP